MAFMLNDFNVFHDVKEIISETICNAPIITGEQQTSLKVIVPKAIVRV